MSLRERLEPLLAKYDAAVPRYTSYPPIPYWGDVNAETVGEWLAEPLKAQDASLSLYTHIPFCRSRCHYCGCFVIITPHSEPADRYMEAVHREMEMIASHIPSPRPVTQYHLGGGTPNFISADAMARLVDKAASHFPFAAEVEMSIEADPRHLNPSELKRLREIGFNRNSMGVQDFDEQVQGGVNRVQPYEQVADQMSHIRDLGFDGVNFDLIYGLPHQTKDSFARTVERVLALRPDRLAIYNFAYLPQAFPHQQKMPAETIPDASEKLSIFLTAREMLTENGYRAIGLDHFALADDELALAYNDGSIRRNFMGYTTQAGTEMLAFGVSAISEYNGRFWQNEKKLARYQRTIDGGTLPIVRGMKLAPDDLLRKAIISDLFCRGRIDLPTLRDNFGVEMTGNLASELEKMPDFSADGLVDVNDEGVQVTELGQFFLRNIALVFDNRTSASNAPPVRFSRSV